jgi:hypothetical protein
MRAFSATWIGDDDPGAQIIHMGGLRFIKGEATQVPGDHHMAETIKENPLFATGNDDPAPTPAANEEEERVRLQALLDQRGIKVRANASPETMREALAKA